MVFQVSLKEKILKAFTIYEHGDHLDHMTMTILYKQWLPFLVSHDGQSVPKEKIFKNGGRQTEGRRTHKQMTEDAYTISSSCEPNGSVELKVT